MNELLERELEYKQMQSLEYPSSLGPGFAMLTDFSYQHPLNHHVRPRRYENLKKRSRRSRIPYPLTMAKDQEKHKEWLNEIKYLGREIRNTKIIIQSLESAIKSGEALPAEEKRLRNWKKQLAKLTTKANNIRAEILYEEKKEDKSYSERAMKRNNFYRELHRKALGYSE